MGLLKSLFVLIISFAIIIFIAFSVYQKGISNSLDQKNKNITALWNNFKSDLTTRDNILADLALSHDSLRYWLQGSINERIKKENDLDLVFYEYKINEFIMAYFPNQKQILDFNVKLNSDLSKYNSMTRQYNEYISIYPNFIVAKKYNYHRAKYFDITYGNINKDPVQASKEQPEWAKGVDTN